MLSSLKSSPELQMKRWSKTSNNPKMSTPTNVFVRVTRFYTHSHTFLLFLEGEPDGFGTGECAADAAVLTGKLASLRTGGTVLGRHRYGSSYALTQAFIPVGKLK